MLKSVEFGRFLGYKASRNANFSIDFKHLQTRFAICPEDR
jgi:hypothetical protein